MADIVKQQLLAKSIQLAEQVSKAADEVSAPPFKQECLELKSKTEKLAALLLQATSTSSDLSERPARRIIGETEQVLDKTLTLLVLKCRGNDLMNRVFSIVSAAAFRKMSSQLEDSIGDVSWLLKVSAPAEERGGDEYIGIPPIAANEPILVLIWEQIATLQAGSLDDRSDAAASLLSLARDNDRYVKLIIQEGGVGPLLKFIKETKKEGLENAARATGLLGRDPDSLPLNSPFIVARRSLEALQYGAIWCIWKQRNEKIWENVSKPIHISMALTSELLFVREEARKRDRPTHIHLDQEKPLLGANLWEGEFVKCL